MKKNKLIKVEFAPLFIWEKKEAKKLKPKGKQK